jgi:hypothetical protein
MVVWIVLHKLSHDKLPDTGAEALKATPPTQVSDRLPLDGQDLK